MRCARIALVLALLAGCGERQALPRLRALDPGRVELRLGSDDVDLLFVIDNSNSPVDQRLIVHGFSALLERLRSPLFGGHLPDLHVGVTSSDLGAGTYGLPSCEEPGGDGGRLICAPRMVGCTPPTQPWIAHTSGLTNIREGSDDALQRVHDAFACIAEIGSGGCGFEQHLEAARQALDPALDTNPGFQRPDGLLAVVLITEEDDCSAARPALYDPADSTLGPLTSFRCTEHGLQCDEPLRPPGIKHNCRPAGDWLVKVEDYVQFFQKLRQPGRALLLAITGPAGPIEVHLDMVNPFLRESCHTSFKRALPAPRIAAVAAGLGPQGLHNPAGVQACDVDFEPAFRELGAHILRSLDVQCLGHVPLTRSGALSCAPGEVLVDGTSCPAARLEPPDCVVTDVSFHDERELGPCPPGVTDCSDGHCPCWRVVSRPQLCAPAPQAIQVLRDGGGLAPVNVWPRASCAVDRAR